MKAMKATWDLFDGVQAKEGNTLAPTFCVK